MIFCRRYIGIMENQNGNWTHTDMLGMAGPASLKGPDPSISRLVTNLTITKLLSTQIMTLCRNINHPTKPEHHVLLWPIALAEVRGLDDC